MNRVHSFHIGKAYENLQLHGVEVQTWIFDPPYNVGFRYDAIDDRMPEYAYHVLMQQIAREMFEKTKEGG